MELPKKHNAEEETGKEDKPSELDAAVADFRNGLERSDNGLAVVQGPGSEPNYIRVSEDSKRNDGLIQKGEYGVIRALGADVEAISMKSYKNFSRELSTEFEAMRKSLGLEKDDSKELPIVDLVESFKNQLKLKQDANGAISPQDIKDAKEFVLNP